MLLSREGAPRHDYPLRARAWSTEVRRSGGDRTWPPGHGEGSDPETRLEEPWASGKSIREVLQAQGVAVVDAAVAAVEELEVDVRHAEGGELLAERLRAEVEVRLVPATRVDPDRPHPAQRLRVTRRHSHRVPREPPLPNLGHEPARVRPVREVNRPVLVGRVAGGHAPVVQEHVVVLLRERG